MIELGDEGVLEPVDESLRGHYAQYRLSGRSVENVATSWLRKR